MTWLEHRGFTPAMLSEMSWRARFRARQRILTGGAHIAASLMCLVWLAVMGYLWSRCAG
jgi:hypothetical protein